MRPLLGLIFLANSLSAGIIYSNITDTLAVPTSIIFAAQTPDPFIEAGDQIQFALSSNTLTQATIYFYNDGTGNGGSGGVVTSDAILRIYDVGAGSTLGSLLGTFTLPSVNFTEFTDPFTLDFTLNNLVVGQEIIWTVAFSTGGAPAPAALGINNIGLATIGSSDASTYWYATATNSLALASNPGDTTLNYMAVFTAQDPIPQVPEPSTIALSALALGALVYSKRRR